MLIPKKTALVLALSILVFTFAALPAEAKGGGDEYGKVVSHLKSKYRAKKVKIPFMWLARFAVGIVRPAGVKSFNITLFEKLQFSRATLDAEMNAAMKNSLGPDWAPVMRVRSHEGQQVYMNMKEVGDNVKIMMVAIDKEGAAIVRATFSPEGLAGFINDPKIFGISLNDGGESKKAETKPESETPATVEVKKDN
jgi:hypothetical protein